MKRNERLLIVGGGIGGLALGAGLRRLGLSPMIVEKAPRFGTVGAGILLGTNAMAMLDRLGLADAVLEAGYIVPGGEVTDVTGRCLSRINFDKLASDFGPTVTIHRAALHEALLAGCQNLDLRSGTTVDQLFDRGDAVEVKLSDGTVAEFDQVVGADGLHSRTRGQVFGETAPAYAGYTCWRFVVKRPPGLHHMQEMWGRGKRLGLVPLSNDRLYCFACANASAGESDPEANRVERFRKRFGEFGGFAPAVLQQIVSPDQLIRNDLADLPKHPWFKGRVLLIGDAGHATTPNMGQGAAMALEDAAVLCEMLEGGTGWSEVVPAFAARREPRVRFIVDQSRRIGRIGQLDNRVLATARNLFARIMPQHILDIGARRAAAAAI